MTVAPGDLLRDTSLEPDPDLARPVPRLDSRGLEGRLRVRWRHDDRVAARDGGAPRPPRPPAGHGQRHLLRAGALRAGGRRRRGAAQRPHRRAGREQPLRAGNRRCRSEPTVCSGTRTTPTSRSATSSSRPTSRCRAIASRRRRGRPTTRGPRSTSTSRPSGCPRSRSRRGARASKKGGEARFAAWTRLLVQPHRPDGSYDMLALAVPSDSIGPAIGQGLGGKARNFMSLSLEIGIRFIRPPEGPVGAAAHALLALRRRLRDRPDRALGRARQPARHRAADRAPAAPKFRQDGLNPERVTGVSVSVQAWCREGPDGRARSCGTCPVAPSTALLPCIAAVHDLAKPALAGDAFCV